MGYKFSIEYKKGSANKAADALSRREDSTADADGVECIPELEEARCTRLLVVASQPVPHLMDLLRRETMSSTSSVLGWRVCILP